MQAVTWLLKHGADPAVANAAGRTPLAEAKLLGTAGAAVSWTLRSHVSCRKEAARAAEATGKALLAAAGSDIVKLRALVDEGVDLAFVDAKNGELGGAGCNHWRLPRCMPLRTERL